MTASASVEPVTVGSNPTEGRSDRPRSPESVLTALADDGVVGASLGRDVVRAYTATKRREPESFRDTVTAWEREHYVETL